MRLAMSILARDEADIIEQNIRYHASRGVDYFIVTDNSSRDGTREILEQLASEFPLDIIDEPSLTIDQDLWVTRMAYRIRDEDKADWIINNDADEFWMTEAADLKAAITKDITHNTLSADAIGTLYCDRNNMIASREMSLSDTYSFRDNIYKVVQTLTNAGEQSTWSKNNSNSLIRTLPGKVISRTKGLMRIDMGNHNADHELMKISSNQINILHYPVRNFAQFERKVVNYGESLKKNQRFAANTSRHLRYWYELHQQGKLFYEYLNIMLPESQLRSLLAEGKLIYDYSMVDPQIQRAA